MTPTLRPLVLIESATTPAAAAMKPSTGVTIADFRAYMPSHKYIFEPSRELWPASSVNSRLQPVRVIDKDGAVKFLSATEWLDQYQPVEQMTWVPGAPPLIRDQLISEGGWISRDGVTVFNLYKPPQIVPGDAGEAEPWVQLVHLIYPCDACHIMKWSAHRVQRPGDKINHALILGGAPGIGKDSIVEPLKRVVGPWNFSDVSPAHLLGRFNGFVKSVILRVSEARDLGDVNRYAFYEHMKVFTAAPPDVLRCDEKIFGSTRSSTCAA